MNAFAPRTPHPRKADANADALLRTELAELLPPPPVPELAPERDRELRHTVLRTALASGDGAAARPPRERRSRGGLRLGWIAAPVAACAVVAGAVVLAPQEGPTGSPGRVSAHPAPEAVRFLSGAALAAAAAPAPDARPGGYVYVRSLVAHAGRDAAGGPATLPAAHQREVWLSVDGSRPGLLREPGAADTELGVELPVYELDGPGATPRKTALATAAPSVTPATRAARPRRAPRPACRR
ncbi:hypothetical protein ACWCQ0_51845 [Streptomyces massasporeus]